MIEQHQENRNVDELLSNKLLPAFRNNASNLIIITAIFLVSCAVGYYRPQVVSEAILKTIKEMNADVNSNSFTGLLSYFGQMTLSLYLDFVMGIAAVIPPVFVALTSGLYTGAIAASENAGASAAFPTTFSDIIESLAMCVSLAWGAKLGMGWFHSPRLPNIKNAFNEGHTVFFKVVMPLLLASLFFKLVMIGK